VCDRMDRVGKTGCRAGAVLLCIWLWGGPVWALDDLAGWRGTRWGMTASEVEAALGGGAERLSGRWLYGGAYAELAVKPVEIGGVTFTAFLQMNAQTDRLQQVLLERRRVGAFPAAFEKLLDALEETYGPPSAGCAEAKRGGQPLDYEMTWRFPTTTIHAKFLDFSTTAIFSRDPEAGRDPLINEREVRRNLRRFMPRRILLRFHDAARKDLDPDCKP
jgi:hypothetical protein